MKMCSKIIIPALTLLALTASRAMADGPDGAQLYIDNSCVACHQASGAGVPATYPALMGAAVVSGDPDTLIKLILLGPDKVLPANSPKFPAPMPPVPKMSDAKIAALLTYIRAKFGNGAAAITEDEVTKVRASLAP
jgi:mono/diheme cytochrome c family protein